MKVVVVNESGKSVGERITSEELSRLVNAIQRHLLTQRVRNRAKLRQKKELTLVFLGAAEMRRINRQYRAKDKPTDILSFASADPMSLGELLLCIPVLKKQAKDQGHSLKHELGYMLIHGILHLSGYDHELSVKEEKLMFGLQDRCFAGLSRFF